MSILDAIIASGGTPLYVGGSVRDELLGIVPKDIDIEVYNLSYDDLSVILQNFGKVDIVGKSFGVIRLTTEVGTWDFSVPRRDSKCGVGHTGFSVTVDHSMTPKDAASRRDFTINSLAKSVNGEIIDHFGGASDLSRRILRPTTSAFWEDPLRLLRGFQFSARFNMLPSEDLHNIPQSVIKEFRGLPSSRIWDEWYKWATKGVNYSTSLEYLKLTSLIGQYPQIAAIDGVPQDPEWHPEGDVYVHTGLVLDWAGKLCRDNNITDYDRCVIIFAALCHDLGKATNTQLEDGRIRSRGHESAAEEPARKFLQSINCPQKIAERVVKLVVNHMVANQPLSDKAVRRLSERLLPATIRELDLLIESDQCGRHPKPKVRSANLNDLRNNAERLNVLDGKPKRIITGDDLIGMVDPGIRMGKVLNAIYKIQLNRGFLDKESGMKFVNGLLRDIK